MAANPRRSRLKFRKKSPIFGAILFACLVTLSESRGKILREIDLVKKMRDFALKFR